MAGGADPAPSAAPALELVGIRKAFGGLVALDGVDFELRAGEVHALLGENGAGKTTLMSVATGLYRPDRGTLRRDGRPLLLRGPADARAAGIGMVHQHPRLSPRHSVLDNVLLGAPGGGFLLDREGMARRLEARAEGLGLPLVPGAVVGMLSVGEQQRVEIVKALMQEARILVLDEPTAVLTPPEAEGLYRVVDRLRAEGTAIVLITHKLDEVRAVADRVTVLRAGRRVATRPARDVDRRELVTLMVGRDVDLGRAAPPAPAPGRKARVVAAGLSVAGDRGPPAVVEVDLELFPGELVAVAGVAGNGQVELAEALYGLRPRAGGTLRVDGVPEGVPLTPRVAIDAGIALIPADRKRTGVAPGLGVAENLLMKEYRSPELSHLGVLRTDRMAARAEALVGEFDVRGVTPGRPAGALSGGNLQKVILARELTREPKVVLAVYPCRGLDVGSIEAVRAHLVAARDRGAAVLLVSEDLDEVLALGDRVAVMYRGRLAGPFPRGRLDRVAIGTLMAGAGGAGEVPA